MNIENTNTNTNTQPVSFSPAIQQRMRAEVAELSREAKALKVRLRQRWHEPMGAVQRRLCEVKLDVTYRMVALAAARGRFHVRAMPRLGSIPGTDQYYFRAPGANLYSLVRWDPAAHRERVVRALLPSYEALSPLAAEQVSP